LVYHINHPAYTMQMLFI